MRPAVVVPVDPARHGETCVGEALEVALPDALLLEAAEEALDHPVLLWGVGCDEFLPKPVVAACGPEASALEDESVVAPEQRSLSLGPQRTEAGDAGLLD